MYIDHILEHLLNDRKTEFGQNMFVNFKHWLSSVNAFDDIERLKQEFMFERLCETVVKDKSF